MEKNIKKIKSYFYFISIIKMHLIQTIFNKIKYFFYCQSNNQYSRHNKHSKIQRIIEDTSIDLYDNQKEYMCLLKSSILKKYALQWELNIINKDKVQLITNHIKHKTILDSTLQCYFFDNQLFVFDGCHRLEALIHLYNFTGFDKKVCCYIYNMNHLHKHTIEQEIIEKYQIINSRM